jgi:hypothetical protein
MGSLLDHIFFSFWFRFNIPVNIMSEVLVTQLLRMRMMWLHVPSIIVRDPRPGKKLPSHALFHSSRANLVLECERPNS